jgi:SAM-dependent methyltransferase
VRIPLTDTQNPPLALWLMYLYIVLLAIKIDRPRRDHISSTHGTYSLSQCPNLSQGSKYLAFFCFCFFSRKNQHAHAAELLLPYLRDRPTGARVLDVGAGSGYLTSVFYHLVFPNNQSQPQPQTQPQEESERRSSTTSDAVVVGIEHIPALTALAEKNIRADGLGRAIDSDERERGIVLVTGDGRLGAFRAVFYFWVYVLNVICVRVR